MTTRFLLIITCIALGLSSCSDRADETRSGRVTITWLVPQQLDRPLVESLVTQFREENPDIDLRPIFVPGSQYPVKLKTLIAAGQPPDVFCCGDIFVAYLLPFMKDLQPLADRDAAEVHLDDVYPQILDVCKWKGNLRLIPRWFNVSLLYYNRKLFDESHEPYPTSDWTWDDYLACAQRLTKRDADGTVQSWGSQIVTGWWGEWLTLIQQSGGKLFDDDIQRCLLDQPEAQVGMKFYVDKVWKHRVSPAPGRGPDAGFASGKLAMELVGHVGEWTKYNQLPELDWDIQLLPAGPASRTGGEMTLEAIGMSKDTPHVEECWRFIKFMFRKSSIRAHADAGYLPIRKSVAAETFLRKDRTSNPRHAELAYEALKYAEPIPRSPDFIEIALDVIQPEIDRALADGTDITVACRRAAQAANDFITTLGNERRDYAPPAK
ncbi:MAG: sugar ABC transporter substrate-binding protein [Anaerolineae bacterium]|nr:sugar ABC transporter substrate-binding protein [Phycisphaerae bacterium]